jgi:hypothetical protein
MTIEPVKPTVVRRSVPKPEAAKSLQELLAKSHTIELKSLRVHDPINVRGKVSSFFDLKTSMIPGLKLTLILEGNGWAVIEAEGFQSHMIPAANIPFVIPA